MTTPSAFFEPDGDDAERFVGTAWTAGPWDRRTMHFGPPAALLGGRMAAELPDDGTPRRVVRLTFEILGPVPVGPVRVATRVGRPGRRIVMVEGELRADDGRALALARGWAIREAPQDLPATTPEDPPPPGPHDVPAVGFFPGNPPVSYGGAFELRSGDAGMATPGDKAVWFRTDVAVVAGEELTPLDRTLLVADSGNGVSAQMPPADWLFVNPDLSVHLHRLPTGPWVALDARTLLHPDGIGQATARLSDQDGAFGRSCQSLIVEPQPS